MRQRLLRHKDTNIIYFASPALEKKSYLIPVSYDEVEFNPVLGIQYAPKAKVVEKGLDVVEPEEPDDLPQEKDGVEFIIDTHPMNMSLPDMLTFIGKANELFPEFAIELPQDPKRPEVCRLATGLFKQIKEFAEKNNE